MGYITREKLDKIEALKIQQRVDEAKRERLREQKRINDQLRLKRYYKWQYQKYQAKKKGLDEPCLLYTSPSPRDS